MKTDKKTMADQELDQLFRSNLEYHEVSPDDMNWSAIRKWKSTPSLYLFLKDTRFKASAVILLCLTSGILLFLDSNNSSTRELSLDHQVKPVYEETVMTPTVDIHTLASSSDFVLDISPEAPIKDIESRDEIIEKEIDEYLAILFEDENEFAGLIDSLEICKALLPAGQLPIDEMFSHIPTLAQQEEFTILAPLETRITLPHRFVKSEKEVEDYLTLYDRNSRQQ